MIFDDVHNFQRAFGQEPGTFLSTAQVAMICEEFAEFADAVGLRALSFAAAHISTRIRDDGDESPVRAAIARNLADATPSERVAMLDAAVDLIYVAAGFCNAMQFDGAGAWDEVHSSNMAKVFPDGTVHRDASGKVIKPRDWTPPDLAPFANQEGE